MNTVSCTCRVFSRNFQRSYIFIPHRSPVLNSPTKLLVGLVLVPVIPSVSAQSDKNETAKLKAVEVIKNEISKSKAEEEISTNNEESQSIDNKSGWERVRAIFQKSDEGHMSKELNATLQSTYFACVIGIIYGGVLGSKRAYLDFMERNQASIFENHLDAKRRLQNHVTIHFGKGALRWALRLSLFTGGFMMFLTTMSAYRGHTSIIDYTLSGAVVGAMLRVRLGPPGVAVGGVLGGVLGLLCGFSTQGLLNLYGSSFDEVISFQYEIDRRRHELFKEKHQQVMEESTYSTEEIEMLKGHEKEESGI